MTNKEALHIVKSNFANKYHCLIEDFNDNVNKAIVSSDSFFDMICFGNAVVARVDYQIFDWSKDFLSKHVGFRCFDGIQMIEIYKKLTQFNFSIGCGNGAIADVTIKRSIVNNEINIRIYENKNIKDFMHTYDNEKWHMVKPDENTYMVVAAYFKDKLVGISSADRRFELCFDIDSEVLPEFRGKGIAISLTSTITNILIDEGSIPIATGAWSNINARKTLVKCGFYPSWAGIGTESMEFAQKVIDGNML